MLKGGGYIGAIYIEKPAIAVADFLEGLSQHIVLP
jgi:hypothetical protein